MAAAAAAIPAVVPPAGLPECDTIEAGEVGACFTLAGRGFAAYTKYKGCFNSWLAPPGFHLMPDWLLAIAYIVATVWLFMGVAIAADVFMDAILVITSSTRVVYARDPATGKRRAVGRTKVWNWVVACLTLMALGSSAPEILLSIIETVTSLGEPAGKLGPAVVVGAAAFNVFNITLCCTLALPTGTTKRISQYPVFLVTALFALWAYVWLAMVYGTFSPGIITVGEAVATLLMFPALVVCAWLTDKVTNWRRKAAAARAAGGDAEAPAASGPSAAPPLGRGSIVQALLAGGGDDEPLLPLSAGAAPTQAARRYTSAIASRLALLEGIAGHADAVERARDSLAVLALAPKAATIVHAGGEGAGGADGGPRVRGDVRALLGVKRGMTAPPVHVRAASYAVRPGGRVVLAVVRRGAAAAAGAAPPTAAAGGEQQQQGSPALRRATIGEGPAAASGASPPPLRRGSLGAPEQHQQQQQQPRPWVRLKFCTEDADAIAGEHYAARKGSVVLAPDDDVGEIALQAVARKPSRRYPDGDDGAGGGDGARSFFVRVTAVEVRADAPPPASTAATRPGASGGDGNDDNDDDGGGAGATGEGWMPAMMPADAYVRVDIVPEGSGPSPVAVAGAPAGAVGWERPGIELRGVWEAAAAARNGAAPAHVTVEAVVERFGIGAGAAVFERACGVQYVTRDGSARAGRDYRAASGELRFWPGETSHVVRVRLLPPAPARAAAATGGEPGPGPTPDASVKGGQRAFDAADAAEAGVADKAAAGAAAAAGGGSGDGGGKSKSKTFSLVLSEPSGGCAVARGPGGAVLRVTIIPSKAEEAAAAAAAAAARAATDKPGEGGATAATAGAAAGGDQPLMKRGSVGASVAAAWAAIGGRAEDAGAAAAADDDEQPAPRAARYPLRERWLGQFRDAIIYPPPPALGDDDAGGAGDGDAAVEIDGEGKADGGGDTLKALPDNNGAKAAAGDGGDDDDDAGAIVGGDEPAPPAPPAPSKLGLAAHLLTVVFKFLLATVPPVDWCGGYPAFIGALLWVGAFIAIIEQTANGFGCAVDLPQLVVGIVVVAAGTTVPDTWASVVAARHDADADAAIANAFGSCAVNVFLGLGLPWTISSIYQAMRGLPLLAPAGDLGFSVALFSGLAGAAVIMLFLKRTFRGGELGGPTAVDKYVTAAALLAFWLTYVIVSSVRAVASDHAVHVA